MTENTISKKSINNAISAYLMLFISGTFLLNKTNPDLFNKFVRSHTKIAFLLHINFILIYIIFIKYNFLKEIFFLGYNLNDIIASSLFIINFLLLLFGIYKASLAQTFKIGDIIHIGGDKNLLDISQTGNINEKDKLTLILSYIPFIGYYIQGKYYKNKYIQNIIKLNILISTIIAFIFISGNKNIVLLFSLFYIIFIVFASINIVINNKIISINSNFLLSPSEILDKIKIFYIYIYRYIANKNFVDYKNLTKIFLEQKQKKQENLKLELNKYKESKFPNFLIYIPFINLIGLFFLKNNNKKIHILNGVGISLFFIIFIILNSFYIINKQSFIILIFPIFFGLGFLNNKLEYKIPIIYDFIKILNFIKNIFSKTKKTIEQKQKEVHSETLKVKKTRS